jgi:hypothetical protein
MRKSAGNKRQIEKEFKEYKEYDEFKERSQNPGARRTGACYALGVGEACRRRVISRQLRWHDLEMF